MTGNGGFTEVSGRKWRFHGGEWPEMEVSRQWNSAGDGFTAMEVAGDDFTAVEVAGNRTRGSGYQLETEKYY